LALNYYSNKLAVASYTHTSRLMVAAQVEVFLNDKHSKGKRILLASPEADLAVVVSVPQLALPPSGLQ
jgi:hypothetical protein